MACWSISSYPQAHEDEAERAVRAGLELIAAVAGLKTRAALQTRVGIATGLVVDVQRTIDDFARCVDEIEDGKFSPAPPAVPHISLTLSVMIVPSCGLASVRPTRCGASKPFSRITRRTRRGLARTPAKRNRAHNLR
jgi:hypothetical protein